MSRRNEKTFLQRGHADGQEAHEKMLNTANHQGNANENHSEISPHSFWDGYHQKEHRWASLVAQWLRICLPMQGTRVRALVWEDPTCRGATGPVSHNY